MLKLKKVKKDNQPIKKADWICDDSYSGQLAVDVFQKDGKLFVVSTIAGVKPSDLEIFIDHDLLTVRGIRKHDMEVREKDYFYKECYFGGFSRSIILPAEVNVDAVKADIKNGVLVISLPLAEKKKKIEVKPKKS